MCEVHETPDTAHSLRLHSLIPPLVYQVKAAENRFSFTSFFNKVSYFRYFHKLYSLFPYFKLFLVLSCPEFIFLFWISECREVQTKLKDLARKWTPSWAWFSTHGFLVTPEAKEFQNTPRPLPVGFLGLSELSQWPKGAFAGVLYQKAAGSVPAGQVIGCPRT